MIQSLWQIRFLSLHDCGLLDVPHELLERPKNYLDFSENCMRDISQNVQCEQLKGLNRSNKAFVQWPLFCSE
jgi:hypothetical protein